MAVVMPKGWTAKAWVRQQRERNLGWTDCVAEWIDNSIGNGALRVDVSWFPRLVEVRDSGKGCTPRMFAALVSPGWHEENEDVENKVSRYGIGAKDGFTWCQGPTQCFSHRDGDHLFIEVDWDSFGDAFDFEAPQDGEPARRKCLSVGLQANGVVIRQQHNRQINIKAFEQVHSALSKIFWAAVETGVEIDVRFYPNGPKKRHRGGLLAGKPMPKLADGHQMGEEFRLADGRLIRIEGGILDSSVRMSNPGFEYIYGHRVVIAAGGTGAGDLDFERCYFRVLLLGDKTEWRVTTNKNRLHDADEAALEQAVFDRCKSLLEQSSKGDYATLLDQELLDDLSERLTAANRKHAKRKAASSDSGTVEPVGSGREHSQASKTHDRSGKYRKKGAAGAISVKKAEFGDEDSHLVGKALVADRLVRLNSCHEYIEDAFQRRDTHVLNNVAMALWSHAWINQEDNGQKRHVPRADFVEKLSSMLLVEQGQEAVA
jgi:hypothetical protein